MLPVALALLLTGGPENHESDKVIRGDPWAGSVSIPGLLREVAGRGVVRFQGRGASGFTFSL